MKTRRATARRSALHRAHSSEPKAHLDWFERFARAASAMAGKPVAFLAALGIVILWLATGPVFGFSDTWQLIINAGTTVVTFLTVFLLQHSQNRDTVALQLKLAELHVGYTRKAEQTLKRLEAKRRSARETASRA